MIAEIVLNNPARGLGKVFDYKIDEKKSGTVTVGQMVTVPFGIGNREEVGFVVNIKEKSEFKRLKTITKIIDVDFVLGEKEFELAKSLQFKTVYLGKRILRAETCSIILTALVMSGLGEL